MKPIGVRNDDISTMSNNKSRLINILEEKPDYLVISPPKINKWYILNVNN